MSPDPAVSGAPAQPHRPAWRAVVGTFAGMFLGAVFLIAVWAKMFDVSAFAESIASQDLAILLSADALAYLALAGETIVGVLLLLNARRLWLLVPTAALVAFLLWVNLDAYLAWSSGEVPPTTACGCFGNLVQRTPGEALWQDALLVVPALLLSFLGRPHGVLVPRVRTAVSVLLAIAVTVFAWQAPNLPLDDLPFVTNLYPGQEVESICAGAGEDRVCLADDEVAPELASGRHVVVLADLGDPAFAEEIGKRLDELLAWEEDDARSRLVILHDGEREAEFAFGLLSRGAPLDLRRGPHPLLRGLYRTIPRTFVVEDGVVVRTWNGFPHLAELTTP